MMDCPRCGQTLVENESVCWLCGLDYKTGAVHKESAFHGAVPEAFAGQAGGTGVSVRWGRLAFIGAVLLVAFGLLLSAVWVAFKYGGTIVDKMAGTKAGAAVAAKAGMLSSASPNQLKAGRQSGPPAENISINEPVELDFKTKAEVLSIRGEYVDQHKELLDGSYQPMDAVFGQIENGRPWWGLKGQFCNGAGVGSIEGPSEESRFIANPFLLLGVDEGSGFRVEGPCYPVYPVPSGLAWNAKESIAVVTYDLSGFMSEKRSLHAFDTTKISFMLENLNARDFGFNYVYVESSMSNNVAAISGSIMFDEPAQLKSYIHRGESCGYSGGCNNASPSQPEIFFVVEKLPATLYCKLWKEKPKTLSQPGDFTYLINFR